MGPTYRGECADAIAAAAWAVERGRVRDPIVALQVAAQAQGVDWGMVEERLIVLRGGVMIDLPAQLVYEEERY